MLACELIDNNGKELLKCVNQYIDQWELEDSFRKYVNEDCTFCGSRRTGLYRAVSGMRRKWLN